jgi:pilus assembly protein FimV
VAATPAAAGDDVDPLAEADLYLNFGRDAQAEEVLKEALQKNPRNEDAQLKLLQIYAGRKDKASFENIAKTLHAQTDGTGTTWLKAAAMGYALDSANSLYEAGRSAPVAAAPIAPGAAGSTDLDFDFELAPTTAGTRTDVEFDVGAEQRTMIMEPGVFSEMAAQDTNETVDITSDSGMKRAAAASAAAPDFSLSEPPGAQSREPDITLDTPADDVERTSVSPEAGPMASAIDFDFDAAPPERGKGYTHDGTVIMSPENQDKATDLSMDFELDDSTATTTTAPLGKPQPEPVPPEFTLDLPVEPAPPVKPLEFDGIDLTLEDANKTVIMAPPEPGPKDDHWYDVQTKFDLAKAYQEMGDKDGAREILQEVIKEGDTGQQGEAKKLLDALG